MFVVATRPVKNLCLQPGTSLSMEAWPSGPSVRQSYQWGNSSAPLARFVAPTPTCPAYQSASKPATHPLPCSLPNLASVLAAAVCRFPAGQGGCADAGARHAVPVPRAAAAPDRQVHVVWHVSSCALQTAVAVLYHADCFFMLPAALHPADPGSVAAESQALLQTCVGFLAAWVGACWFGYSAVMLWAFRTGMLQA